MHLMDVYFASMDDGCEAHFASVDSLTHPADRADYANDSMFALHVAQTAQASANDILRAFRG